MILDYLKDPDYLKIFTTVLLAVFGWLVANYFANRRNAIQRKKEITVKHLINAYRVLTNEISRRELTSEGERKLENIISDLQLFGSPYQIDLTKNLIDELTKGKSYNLDPLINSLRKELRVELKLTEVEGNVHWLRYEREEKN